MNAIFPDPGAPIIHRELRSQDLVAVVKVHFYNMPDLIFSEGEWDKVGGYKAMLKDYAIGPGQIKAVKRSAMAIYDFAKLGEWNA